LSLLQEQYADALAVQDQEGVFETCGVLAVTYASLGMHDLAKRWSVEYVTMMFEKKLPTEDLDRTGKTVTGRAG